MSPNTHLSSEEELELRFRRMMSEDNAEEEIPSDPPTEKQWNYFFKLFDDLTPLRRNLSRAAKIDQIHALALKETGIDLHECQRWQMSTIIDWMKDRLAEEPANESPRTSYPWGLSSEDWTHFCIAIRELAQAWKEGKNHGS